MSVYPRRNGKGRPLDLTGFKFGKLKVIEESYIKNYKHYWLCKCECGNECIVCSSDLTIGKTKSCGCLKHKSYHITHGLGKPKETYSHWYNIKTRCFNKNHPRYKDWGGRGIIMCDEWKNDFKSFHNYVTSLEHFGEDGYNSIDRIDNNGNYEPGNIRWATVKMQNNNKRNVRKKVVL